MIFKEEDCLQISGIQHFAFCKRQWALIYIEGQWIENLRTAEGRSMHKNAHDTGFSEKRGDLTAVRGMRVRSAEYGISGECDVVEFIRDDTGGIPVTGLDGRYRVNPVEYKRGSPKEGDCDIMQLCAQALCLEEMLCCEITEGCLYYGETKRRLRVSLDNTIREKTLETIGEMHRLYDRGHTPAAKRTRSCNACSLRDICLPELEKKNVSEYLREMMKPDL